MSRVDRPAFRLIIASSAAALFFSMAALAQGTPAPAPADPVVAKVDGRPIYLSDLKAAAQALPENLRGMAAQNLYPMLLDQLIDGRALVDHARKSGLDKDPDVQRQMNAAQDQAHAVALRCADRTPKHFLRRNAAAGCIQPTSKAWSNRLVLFDIFAVDADGRRAGEQQCYGLIVAAYRHAAYLCLQRLGLQDGLQSLDGWVVIRAAGYVQNLDSHWLTPAASSSSRNPHHLRDLVQRLSTVEL